MGIIYLCDRRKGIIFTVWCGEVTWNEWFNHIQVVLADPVWHEIPRLIVDMQFVSDTSSISERQMHQAAAEVGENQFEVIAKRIAVVAADEFRRTSQFEVLVRRFGVAMVVFNSLDTACTFLGVDRTDTEQVLEQLRTKLRKDQKESF